MLTADKYLNELQEMGFDEKQAKQVAKIMLTFSGFIVDSYIANRKGSEAKNHSENVAKTDQKTVKNLAT